MNKHLVEAVNSRGMVVRYCEPTQATQFGDAELIIIEGATHEITFVSNVLQGRNYFNIRQVKDLYKNRTYTAHRYFHKFIKLIAEINGETYIKLQEENK